MLLMIANLSINFHMALMMVIVFQCVMYSKTRVIVKHKEYIVSQGRVVNSNLPYSIYYNKISLNYS